MIAGAATCQGLLSAPDRVLVTDDSGGHTGAEMDAAVNRLANQILTKVPTGGSLGIWGWNSAELLVAHLAAERAGVTRVPVDPEAPAGEAEVVMAEVGVSLVIVDADHATADWKLEEILLSREMWSSDDGPPVGPVEIEVEEAATAVRIVRGMVNGELLAIPLSYANWDAHMTLAERLFRARTYDVPHLDEAIFLTVQQMQYATGIVGTFPFIRMALPQVIVTKFDPGRVSTAVVDQGASVTFMVPGMVTRLADHVKQIGFSAWDLHILYGGAPFPLDDMLAAMGALGTSLTQLYGRFEGGWPITVLDSHDHARILSGEHELARTCGRRVEGVDLDLRKLSGGDSTELRVRSRCVSAAFADPDGWCSLGDVATIDRGGYLSLAGRVDGMINTGSFHVYPSEVEAAMLVEFPEISSVTVMARSDERWGQAVCAQIAWPRGADIPSRPEFRARLSARLAKYKVPTIIEHEVDGRPVRSPDDGVVA